MKAEGAGRVSAVTHEPPSSSWGAARSAEGGPEGRLPVPACPPRLPPARGVGSRLAPEMAQGRVEPQLRTPESRHRGAPGLSRAEGGESGVSTRAKATEHWASSRPPGLSPHGAPAPRGTQGGTDRTGNK